MTQPRPTPTQRALAVVSAIAPPLGAEIAYRVWRTIGAPLTVHARDADIHAAARVGRLTLANGREVVTYAWGSGERMVLLVHGWRSRASRFGSLIAGLLAEDRTIVAFDAPGNGDAPGDATTILDYAEAIALLHDRHGRFEAIIAHSFGVLAAFEALRQGVSTERLVAISGMHDADQLVDQLARQLTLPPKATRGLRRRIERRTFPQIPDLWRRFVAELEPTDTTPLLLVHDAGDRLVDVSQAALIAEAHLGPTTVMITEGLGHNRPMSDPGVIAAIRTFLDAPLGAVPDPAASERA
jgi:alpha-beta hydrolase superfamily lysophospholipase